MARFIHREWSLDERIALRRLEGQPLLVSWNGQRAGQPGDVGGVRVRRLGSRPGAAFPDGSAIGVLEFFSHTSISGCRANFPNRFEAFESYLNPISEWLSIPAYGSVLQIGRNFVHRNATFYE
jgi:hypothetical protein